LPKRKKPASPRNVVAFTDALEKVTGKDGPSSVLEELVQAEEEQQAQGQSPSECKRKWEHLTDAEQQAIRDEQKADQAEYDPAAPRRKRRGKPLWNPARVSAHADLVSAFSDTFPFLSKPYAILSVSAAFRCGA
jgi:hypothetical protein